MLADDAGEGSRGVAKDTQGLQRPFFSSLFLLLASLLLFNANL